jgi:hypothetical protein
LDVYPNNARGGIGFFICSVARTFFQTKPLLSFSGLFPSVILVIYNLASAVYYRFKLHFKSNQLEKMVSRKAFGRMVHPTCTTLAILAWGVFIFSPDLKIFVADIWITVVILSWMRLEKSAYDERPKKPENDTSGP